MELNFDQKIIELSKILPTPLYAVGGYVRDFLIDGTISDDIDLASPISVDEILPYIEKVGLVIVATYKRTGTVVFKGNGIK